MARGTSILQQLLIAVVVVPLSFAVRAFGGFWAWITGRRGTVSVDASPAIHEAKVARICADVAAWNALPAQGRPPLRTDRNPAASNAVRVGSKVGCHLVRMHDMNHVLALNEAARTVTVEPMITVGALTSYLLTHGLMLEATLEMEDVTIGGLVLSQGLTTHSHRCGLVHDTMVSCELVTARGERVHASEGENSDVFRATGWSHGTLGLLTAVELRVAPATRELLLTYKVCHSVAQLRERYAAEMDVPPPGAFFLEAIIFSPTHAVIVRGDVLTDELRAEAAAARVPVNHQGRWYKPWYFSHVQTRPEGARELMPMRDYLMRHDRSICMTMLYLLPVANMAFYRYLWGWMIPPSVNFLKTLRPPNERVKSVKEQIYQDLAFPVEHLEDMVAFITEHMHVFPLLVYPFRLFDRGAWLRAPGGRAAPEAFTGTREARFVNLGIYGVPRRISEGHEGDGYSLVRETAALLGRVRAVGGFQHSYCDCFQTREEFYTMFDRTLGDAVRARLGSDVLGEVFDRVKPEVPWQSWL